MSSERREVIDLDSFAGGGGASTGMRGALEKPVDIAINHSDAAIAMHAANHPETRHYCESIWTVDPREVCRGKKLRAAWFSPDCTHFSRAKGGQPRSKEVRGLASVVIEWARHAKPQVIFLENVREFQDWGPLDEKGHPIKERAGEDYRAWLAELAACGYKNVETRVLRADRYGSPTTRERFYLVARRDRQRIVWPAETHGPTAPAPVRTAAEIIDWSLPCPSIFGRKKPLADATLRRIAAGLRRYVIESSNPFIVPVTHTTSGDRTHSIDRPLPVVTTARGGEFALVTPHVVTNTTRHRGRDVREPVPTIATGDHHYLATPFLSKFHGGDARNLTRGQVLEEPLRTLDTENRFAFVAPTLLQSGYGERKGQRPRVLDLHRPLGTIVGSQKHALAVGFLATHNGGVYRQDLDAPLRTVTAREHITAQRVTLAHIEKFYGTASGADVREPLPTVTATGTHLAEVRAFLVKYYGDSDTQRQPVDRPLDVVTTKARFGLVQVAGVDYQIIDIGLRMLSPRELFLAQGFPGEYRIDIEFEGRPMSKKTQIELAGNSVCPQVARALVAANVHERWEAA